MCAGLVYLVYVCTMFMDVVYVCPLCICMRRVHVCQIQILVFSFPI